MNTKVACIVFSCFALASAGVIPVASLNILEGPSTRTKVIGPDGSIIEAYAPGGKIILDANAGPLVQPAPLVIAQPAIAEQHVYPAVELQPVLRVNAESNQNEERLATVNENGPKVFLQTGIPQRVESRASLPITEQPEETSTATTELSYTTEYIETPTSDLSGSYVQDNVEKLYDDGSYRPEHF